MEKFSFITSVLYHIHLCFFTDRMGYEAPTLIQAQAIPVILAGRHVYVSLTFLELFIIILVSSGVPFFMVLKFTVSACSQNENYRLVNAATGTGKTVTYLAPVIHHLQKYDRRIQRSDGTFGMCMVNQ